MFILPHSYEGIIYICTALEALAAIPWLQQGPSGEAGLSLCEELPGVPAMPLVPHRRARGTSSWLGAIPYQLCSPCWISDS